MPLRDRDRTKPRRFRRLGKIRLGHREIMEKERADGSTYEIKRPVQDDHFLLHDAPEVEAYFERIGHEGPVRELPVRLPFAEIDRNYDAHYEVWAGGLLVCQGDGDKVLRAEPFKTRKDDKNRVHVKNAKGETVVDKGAALCAFDWNGEHFEPDDEVPCSGEGPDLYEHCGACKIGGLLKVMIDVEELFDFGYYQIATGSGRNYDSILGTLEMVRGDRSDPETGERVAGSRPVSAVPYVLRLVEEETTYRDEGERRRTKKWFLKLVPDRAVMRSLYQGMTRKLLGEPGGEPPPIAEVIEEGVIVEEPAPPPVAEAQMEDAGLPEAIDTLAQFRAATKELGITGDEVKEALGGGAGDWAERENKTLREALDVVRKSCGK